MTSAKRTPSEVLDEIEQRAEVARLGASETAYLIARQQLIREDVPALVAQVRSLLAFVQRYVDEAEASGGWEGDDELFSAALAALSPEHEAKESRQPLTGRSEA